MNQLCNTRYHISCPCISLLLSYQLSLHIALVIISAVLAYCSCYHISCPCISLLLYQLSLHITLIISAVLAYHSCYHISCPCISLLLSYQLSLHIALVIISAVLAYRAPHGLAPACQQELVVLYRLSRSQHSTNDDTLSVPLSRLKTVGGHRFASYMLHLERPSTICQECCVSATFKQRLRMYVYGARLHGFLLMCNWTVFF